MAFPTIPTVAAGRVLTVNQANTTSPRTFPNLSSLTKNNGDLLIAIAIGYDTGSGGAGWSSWGAGFTEFYESPNTIAITIGCAYKWSTGSETGTFTVAQANLTGHATLILLSIPGAHATTPPEAGGWNATTNATMANATSFNPTGWDVEDTLWIAVGGDGESSGTGSYTAISAAPTNYTDLVETGITADVVGGVEGAVAFRQNAAAAEDAGAWTADTSNARHGALTIAVRPAPGPISGVVTSSFGGTLAAAGIIFVPLTTPVGLVSASNPAPSTSTTTASFTPRADSTIYAFFHTEFANTSTYTIADSGSRTWTPLEAQDGVQWHGKLWSAPAGSSPAAMTITFGTGNAYWGYGVFDVDAALTIKSGQVESASQESGASTVTGTLPAAVTSGNTAIALIGQNDDNASRVPLPSGWTNVISTGAGGYYPVRIAYKTDFTGTSTSATQDETTLISGGMIFELEVVTGPTGVVASSFGGTFTAAGIPTTFGVVASNFGGAFLGAGNDRQFGSVASSFGGAFTTAGRPRKVGQVVSSFGGTFTTSGTSQNSGAVTSSFGGTFTTVGLRRSVGVVASNFGGAFLGAGNDRQFGSAVLSFGGAFTTAGTRRKSGRAVSYFGGNGVPAHSPITINTGGTYSGTYVSTDPDVAAVTITTSSVVILDGATIYHAGVGIESWDDAKVTATNCHFTAIETAPGTEQQALRIWEPHTLIVENNTLVNSHGVQVSADNSPAPHVVTTLRIDRNSMLNIGRHSQPSVYQGAVHLDNVQAPGGKVRWNKIVNKRGFSHSEDTIGLSNNTAGSLGNEIEVSYNMIDGTYPISGNGASFTGGAYDFGDIDGQYIIAHHNYALNYTNNGFMIPAGSDIKIHDCVAVYDGLADDGATVVSTFGWGFTVNNLYGGGVSPNTYLEDNRSAHRRWTGSAWENANYQYNPANGGDQDLGGNTVLGVGSQALEDDAWDEWEALVVANSIVIGATGSTGDIFTASGERRILGSSVSSFGGTLAASGVPVPPAGTGTVVSSFGGTLATSGVRRRLGSVVSNFGGAFLGAGNDRQFGSVVTSFGFVSTITGRPRKQGATVSAFGFTSTVSGVDRAVGQSISSFGFVSIATGIRRSRGSVSSNFGGAFLGAGNDRQFGSATSLFGFTSVSSGVRQTRGEVTSVFGFITVVNGKTVILGQVSSLFGGTFNAQSQPSTIFFVSAGVFAPISMSRAEGGIWTNSSQTILST